MYECGDNVDFISDGMEACSVGGGEGIAEKSPGGRYIRFSERVGRGASKEVYRAYDTREGIYVAWNVVELSCVPKLERSRIVNEVRLLERLDHPNIIRFNGSWVNRERQEIHFITELLSSGTLKSFVAKVQVIRWKIAKRWLRQILEGLDYIHSQGIIHRDLKCDNIFINGANGNLRIGDMGLCTVPWGAGPSHSVLGTPAFMAPDMFEENVSYDEKVDIYSFGMCVIEICTHETPYKECMNPAEIYRKVSAGEYPKSLYRIQCPEARDFIMCCLGKRDKNSGHVKYHRPSAAQLLLHPFLNSNSDDDNVIIVDSPQTDALPCTLTTTPMGEPPSVVSYSSESRGDKWFTVATTATIISYGGSYCSQQSVPQELTTNKKKNGGNKGTDEVFNTTLTKSDCSTCHQNEDTLVAHTDQEPGIEKEKKKKQNRHLVEQQPPHYLQGNTSETTTPTTMTSLAGLHTAATEAGLIPKALETVQQHALSSSLEREIGSQRTNNDDKFVDGRLSPRPQILVGQNPSAIISSSSVSSASRKSVQPGNAPSHHQVHGTESGPMQYHQDHRHNAKNQSIYPSEQPLGQEQRQQQKQQLQLRLQLQQLQQQQQQLLIQQQQEQQQLLLKQQQEQQQLQLRLLQQRQQQQQQLLLQEQEQQQPQTKEQQRRQQEGGGRGGGSQREDKRKKHDDMKGDSAMEDKVSRMHGGGPAEILRGRPAAGSTLLPLVVTIPVKGCMRNVQFDFDLIKDEEILVAREMVLDLGLPQEATLEISEMISGLVQRARIKREASLQQRQQEKKDNEEILVKKIHRLSSENRKQKEQHEQQQCCQQQQQQQQQQQLSQG